MYVCTSMYVYLIMYIYTPTYEQTCIYIYIYIHFFSSIDKHLQICMEFYISSCFDLHMYSDAYIYIYV